MNEIENILKNYENGILTYVDANGFHNIDINEFLTIGSDEVLQKLNRTYEVLLKVANADKTKFKWVNDYAMATVVKNLFEKIWDMSSALIEKDTEIERLKNESVASKVAFETIDGIPQEEAEKLNNKIKELSGKLAEKETNCTNLITELNELKNQLSIQDATHDELKKVITENKDLADALNKFKNTCAEQIKEIEALKENNLKFEESYTALTKTNDELNEKFAKLENEINDRKRAFSEMLEKYKTLDDSNNKTQEKNNELENINSELGRQLDELYVDYDKTKYALEEADKEISNYKKTVETFKNNEAALKKYKDAVDHLISSLGLETHVKNGVVEQSAKYMHRMGDHLENTFNAL